jgi:hypothetical protein
LSGEDEAGNQLRARIEAIDGGFITVQLSELREIVGVKRLGVHVLEEIKEWLTAEGIGFFPTWVLTANEQPRHVQELRLYLGGKTGPLELLVEAITEPSVRGDRALRSLARSREAIETSIEISRIEILRAAIDDALAAFERDS